jgi:hypothetical protein
VTTSTAPDDPEAGIVAEGGVNVKLHEAPDCVTAKLCPAIVIVPVRWLAVVFDWTVYPAVPPPVPLCPKEIVIQSAELTADREQVGALATIVITPFPPLAVKFAFGGEIENEHCCAARGTARHTASRKKRTRLLETFQTPSEFRSCAEEFWYYREPCQDILWS